MKAYSEYSAEELAMENLFIRWVRFPDDPSIKVFWENWVLKYPSMYSTVEEAKALVLTASETHVEPLNNLEVNSLWGRIRNSLENIGDVESQVNVLATKEKTDISNVFIIFSISIAIILGLLYLFSKDLLI